MADRQRTQTWGSWLLIAAAAIAFLVSLYDFLLAWAINHTIGAGIVLVSSAILTLAAVAILAWRSMPVWLSVVLLIGLAADVLGTAVAAYFLTEWIVLALMAAAAIGWLAIVIASAATPREQPA